jgi:NADPH:quinone reductase-like Zn-dependent oxidoreductase
LFYLPVLLQLQIAKLLASGDLKVFVAREFPLSESAAAHELSEGGHVRGKIIVRVAPEE